MKTIVLVVIAGWAYGQAYGLPAVAFCRTLTKLVAVLG